VARIKARATYPGFDVTKLADELNCSREHLTRQFVSIIGVSPGEFLSQRRIRLAAAALRSTDAKLDAVARLAGFRSANYLCRSFRQRVGVTPAVFRRQPWLVTP
jgi:AraC-like DNA-binding protein